MNEFTDRVARRVGRHFVSLSCLQQPASGEPVVLLFSGFVADVAGEWFYVTAGHVLRRIEVAIRAGSTFDVWRLGDQTAAGGQFGHTAVPYDFKLDDWVVVEDQDQGLDYAAAHISGLYRSLLEAGGVVALGKEAWSDHTSAFDDWGVFGIPFESVRYDGVTIIRARSVFVALEPADEPELAGGRADNQFFAKLVDGSEAVVRNVEGMSGGPVFKFERTDATVRYGVIGVQSGWYQQSRVLAICPFSSFALALEGVLAPVLEELRRGPSPAPAP